MAASPLRTAVALLLLLSCSTPFVQATPLAKRETELNGFYNCTAGGGSWYTGNTGGGDNVGEPINVVVSAESDYAVIGTESVFLDFMASVNMAGECLGQHAGSVQTMNLGDGLGYRNTTTLRYDYGDVTIGTCKETILGGNHLRYQKQNGSAANSGAWFMSVSYEQNLTYGHNIITPDGYASGRDWLTGNATKGSKSPLTNRTFTTTSISTPGFFPANSSFFINHGLVYDGLVDVWTVKITNNGSAVSIASGSAGSIRFEGGGSILVFVAVTSLGLLALL